MSNNSLANSGSSGRLAVVINGSEDQVDLADLSKVLPRIKKFQPTQKRRKYIVLTIVLLLLMGGSWRGFVYYQRQQLINQIPLSTRKSVSFPIYLPSNAKLNVQANSISYSEGNLIFTIGDNDNRFIVTEQAKPAAFDINKFAGITEPTPLISGLGSGVRGKVANRNIVIFSTDKTLITYVALSNTAANNMDSAVTSLIKID